MSDRAHNQSPARGSIHAHAVDLATLLEQRAAVGQGHLPRNSFQHLKLMV